ncbi:MAG TPA: hypothetical protein VMG39_07070 [Pseudolabrys sp.]|nr:hypothetical protein [Pseudolabrys sp.]
MVLAVAVAAPGAQAQTVITRQISDEPLTTVIAPRPSGTLIAAEPLVTVPSGTLLATPAPANIQTVETVQTVRTTPAAHTAHRSMRTRQIVTTRQTIVRQPVVQGPTVITPTVTATYPQPPLYNSYPAPLYDEVVPAPAVPSDVVPATEETILRAPAYGTTLAGVAYRYIYEPDRILVVDPRTNLVIQTLWR